jgi:predicted HicB family RNase H-like nuclease
MKDIINYKGFIGSVHFSSDDSIFYGKIEGITINKYVYEALKETLSH